MPGHVRARGKRSGGSTIWQARWRHPADARIRVERNFATKREAERWAGRQETNADDGTFINPRRADRPFATIYEAWKRSWDGRLQPQTTLRYEQVWREHLEPAFGTRKTNSITHESVQRFIDGLRDSGAKPGTVRKVHAVLSAAFTEAIRLGVIHTNPCRHVRLPRSEYREMLFLSAPEVRELAEAIDPHFRALVYTAAYTGLRAGELAALRREDIDPLHGTLSVGRALKDVNGRLEFGPTKTHAVRRIKLPVFLCNMLDEHLRVPAPGGSELVFTSLRGAPIQHRLFYRRHFKPAVRGSLPAAKHGLRFHDLRHTCASLLIAAGAHPKAIQERLGHSTITMTLDRYGHLLPGLGDALADALEAAHADAALTDVIALRG
jgi:integrase